MMESQSILFSFNVKAGIQLVYISFKRCSDIKYLKEKINITEIAREISPICDFIFRSIRTSLPTGGVDVDLTIQTEKGIYIYRKDHTAESMIFTPWTKEVILFPSLRWKIQAFQYDKR